MSKTILVVGSGGREHAIVWKLSQSSKVKKIFCAPGNAGISMLSQCVSINAEDMEGLLDFAKKNMVDLTIVGPEAPLTLGIVDKFRENGLKVFGPDKKGAMLEGSKIFCKELLWKYGIETAPFHIFDNYKIASDFLRRAAFPLVIKADGLCAGKGVIIAKTLDEGLNAVNDIMIQKAFGHAGNRIIIEDFLPGEEASFMAITDGHTVLPLATSQDHKAIFDNDAGPNTGGMGAYSPAPIINETLFNTVMADIIIPTVNALKNEGIDYKGVLYAGLMIKDGKIWALEYNCRFGDPEAQVILMRLESDFYDLIQDTVDEKLSEHKIKWKDEAAVCVVMASKGYPGKYVKNIPIKGIEEADSIADTMVFHAGTKIADNQIVTAGGRVLGVTALGLTIKDAIENSYNAVSKIDFEGCQHRKDIGKKALKWLKKPIVSIVMGSKSDYDIMIETKKTLDKFDISSEIRIMSAHRSPDLVADFSRNASKKGIKLIIAGAGMAAHLAGVIAAHTHLPVIGVPIDSSSIKGLDSLLSTVQMPPGVPVGTMGIGKAGAKNAAYFALQILALNNIKLSDSINEFRLKQAEEIRINDETINE